MDPKDLIGIVSLGGCESHLSHEMADERFTQAVGRARCADDIFLHHDGAHVVGSPGERGLSDVGSHRHPTGTDGIDVVQIEPAQCLRAQVVACSYHPDASAELGMIFFGSRTVESRNDIAGEGGIEFIISAVAPFATSAQRCVLTLERPGDECHVAATIVAGEVIDAAILPAANEIHVVDAIRGTLNVAEHHRGGGVHAQLVGYAHDGQPCFGVAFAQSDLPAHGVGEDFTATSGYGMESGLGQRLHDASEFVFQRIAGRVEEVDELDELGWAECMDVHVGEPIADGVQQVDVPVQGKFRVHAALHENLCSADVDESLDLVQNLLDFKGVGIIFIAVASKGAEGALGGTDVGVVDVSIDDVGTQVIAMEVAAAGVRPASKFLNRQFVIQPHGLLRGEPHLAGDDILQDGMVEDICIGLDWRNRGHWTMVAGAWP